jgi:hypothetical protein
MQSEWKDVTIMAHERVNVPIGKHLAVLNLFREPDKSVQITVADGRGLLVDGLAHLPKGHGITPQAYAEQLIVEAARNIVERRPDLKPEASDLAVAIGEHAFRAGFKAGEHWDTREGAPSRGELEERAWSAYDPPEELKGRNF